MTDPIRSGGQPPAPHYEPVLISTDPAHGPSVPVPVGQIALQCLSKLDGAAIAVVAYVVADMPDRLK